MAQLGSQVSYGNTIWLRCGDPSRLGAIAALAARVQGEGDPVRFRVTLARATGDHMAHPQGGREIRAFLARERPLFAIMVGGTLDAATLSGCAAINVPVIAIDARPDTLREMTGGWFRAKPKPMLAGIAAAFVSNPEYARRMQDLGAPGDKVAIGGPLEEGVTILAHNEAERHEIAQSLRNRPLWLARATTVAEANVLAKAHRYAARRSHRLLMLVTPALSRDGADIARNLRDAGYQVGLRSEGEEPEEAMQAYVADLEGEDGLWLRLAPICFAGGTLTRGAANDPFESAALGSVVVHGLNTQPYEDRFQRLLRAGASLCIADANKLGEAVETLLAPDRTAEMATAGWEVTSSGAEISNRVMTLIQDRLDAVGY